MRRDFQISIVLAVAAIPAGAALMAAPEYLHLAGQSLAVTFWGGVILTALLIVCAVAIALRGEAQAAPEGHKYRMIAILGMAVCGAGFMAFAILFFVQRPSEDRVVQSPPSAPLPIVKTPIAPPPAAIPPPPPIPDALAGTSNYTLKVAVINVDDKKEREINVALNNDEAMAV